jgi:hypothetical protein
MKTIINIISLIIDVAIVYLVIKGGLALGRFMWRMIKKVAA